jgi:hypothetical protein
MSARQFEYNGQEWEAEYEGIGTSGGSGFIPSKPQRYSYTLRCVSDKNQPTVRGHLAGPDPNALSEDDLKRELKNALDKSRLANRRPRRTK